MRIALIQQHATEDIDTNIQRGLANLDKAAAQGAEVAVLLNWHSPDFILNILLTEM